MRRLNDVVIRPREAADGFMKDDGFGGNRHASFFSMISVVESNGDKFTHLGHGDSVTNALLYHRQFSDV
ncbi:hypothetical protein D3C73_1429170 [compost metagenome]